MPSSRLCCDEKLLLQLVKLAAFLGHVKVVGSAEDAYHLLQAYAVLTNSGSLPKPVGLTNAPADRVRLTQ